jgi:hypothetical protein
VICNRGKCEEFDQISRCGLAGCGGRFQFPRLFDEFGVT